MIRILLNGYRGRMGAAIAAAITGAEGVELSAKCDMGDNPADYIKDCDAVVDFSFRDVTAPLAKLCADNGKALVIGTTGHTPEQRKEIVGYAAKIPIVWAGNYSVGVNLLNYLTKIASRILDDSYDIEIVEMHHRLKKDAPSGTAEKLREIAAHERGVGDDKMCYGRHGLVGERPVGEIGIHALRGGSVVGDHTVIFAADGERVELSHKAADRKIFANGAVRAVKWVVGKPAGLYGMDDVLNIK